MFNIQVNLTFNLVHLLAWLFGWCLVGLIAYRIYKGQEVKPRIWRIVVVTLVGLFTLSFNIPVSDTNIGISILPIGVWVLFFVMKDNDERWEKYRYYAWLGFWANAIFAVLALVAIPINHLIYPKEEPSTYLANVAQAEVIRTHPAAKDNFLHIESLQKQIDAMVKEPVSGQWYEEMYHRKYERFPYQLIGVSPKWGSGIDTVIYVEDDGKGLLISTSDQQFYFRSNETFLQGVD